MRAPPPASCAGRGASPGTSGPAALPPCYCALPPLLLLLLPLAPRLSSPVLDTRLPLAPRPPRPAASVLPSPSGCCGAGRPHQRVATQPSRHSVCGPSVATTDRLRRTAALDQLPDHPPPRPQRIGWWFRSGRQRSASTVSGVFEKINRNGRLLATALVAFTAVRWALRPALHCASSPAPGLAAVLLIRRILPLSRHQGGPKCSGGRHGLPS